MEVYLPRPDLGLPASGNGRKAFCCLSPQLWCLLQQPQWTDIAPILQMRKLSHEGVRNPCGGRAKWPNSRPPRQLTISGDPAAGLPADWPQ